MSAAPRYPRDLGYAGLRMSADEYLALGETQDRYELIDGIVVMMSPSPFASHNEIAAEIVYQLKSFADRSGGVRIFPETDVRFSANTIYKPDISVYRSERLPAKVQRLDLPPDLVVEVLSTGTQALDLITKRDDYERFGVGEYWAVDPKSGDVRCWRRHAQRLLEASPTGDALECAVLPGMVLDLARVRALADAT